MADRKTVLRVGARPQIVDLTPQEQSDLDIERAATTGAAEQERLETEAHQYRKDRTRACVQELADDPDYDDTLDVIFLMLDYIVQGIISGDHSTLQRIKFVLDQIRADNPRPGSP